MARRTLRRTLRLECLESREVMSAGGPSAEAQYMLEQINAARLNPGAAAQQVLSNLDADTAATLNYYQIDSAKVRSDISAVPSRPALAWSDKLAAAATGQSQDQANTGVQSHTGSDGSTLGQRLDRVGYTNRARDGENAYAYAQSVDNAMQAFLIDWGVADNGHRKNLLDTVPNMTPFREVGIGIVNSDRLGFGPKVITQDFGLQAGSKAELLGVVYDDLDHNGAYSIGEGRGNVEIDATNLQTGQTSSVLSWDAGGYQMALDPGQYNVTAKVGNQIVRSQQVSIGTDNVKVDYRLTDPVQVPSSPSTPPVPKEIAQVAPPTAPAAPATPPAVAQPPQAPATPPAVVPPQTVIQVTPPPAAAPAAPAKPLPLFDASWVKSWTSWSAPTQKS